MLEKRTVHHANSATSSVATSLKRASVLLCRLHQEWICSARVQAFDPHNTTHCSSPATYSGLGSKAMQHLQSPFDINFAVHCLHRHQD